jgi:hypothetical protein
MWLSSFSRGKPQSTKETVGLTVIVTTSTKYFEDLSQRWEKMMGISKTYN